MRTKGVGKNAIQDAADQLDADILFSRIPMLCWGWISAPCRNLRVRFEEFLQTKI
jgi:hypothetical protein